MTVASLESLSNHIHKIVVINLDFIGKDCFDTGQSIDGKDG
jgi:hypothetical protein